MRLLIAGLVMALMIAGAQAQIAPSQSSQIQGATSIGQRAERATQANENDAAKAKANDKAYNAVLHNLPDKQYDPWHGVR
jgi:hypothetical protein